MPLDEVAAEVSIAKASLYKHFASKEDLHAIAILYTIFAWACDPVLEYLKLGQQYTDDKIVAMVLSICFDGLCTRPIGEATAVSR